MVSLCVILMMGKVYIKERQEQRMLKAKRMAQKIKLEIIELSKFIPLQ